MTILHAEQMPFDEPLRRVNRAKRVILQHPTKHRRIHVNARESAFIAELCRRGYVRVGQAGGGA